MKFLSLTNLLLAIDVVATTAVAGIALYYARQQA